jgi:hypothetical protein
MREITTSALRRKHSQTVLTFQICFVCYNWIERFVANYVQSFNSKPCKLRMLSLVATPNK